MKRPSFQFYPGDWQSDLKLRRCSPAARGVWVDILCAMHDSDDGYGLLRWPLREIARTVGAAMAHVNELVDKGVLRGSDAEIAEPFVYVPRSGRKDGAPVTLIAAQPGPLWYSKRLVKDEHVRTIRGESTRFGDDGKPSPKPPKGDGTSSPSSSSPPGLNTKPATQVPGSGKNALHPPNPPPDFDGSNAQALNGRRISALSKAFDLPGDWGLDAEALGFRPDEVMHEAEKFRQYFVAGKGAGKRRTVRGWRQSWSTWLGKAAEGRR